MKKLITVPLVLAMVMSLAACGSGSQKPAEEPAKAASEAAAEPAEAAAETAETAAETSDAAAETAEKPAAPEGEMPAIKIGVLTMLNLSEEEMEDYYDAVGVATFALVDAGKAEGIIESPPEDVEIEGTPEHEIVFFDSLDGMLMALNAGDIDMISIYNSTADYLAASNDQLVKGIDYEFGPDEPDNFYNRMISSGILNNSFSFMMLENNEALRDEFNTAIASMNEDGTLDRLIQEQMQEVVKSGEAKPVEMPVIDGAETIKVAVTGSLPPMDYVAADGSPAGYNTAVLAEISKRIGKNIEIVVVDSIGRAAALSSGAVDAVFWTRSNDMFNEIAERSEEEDAEAKEKLISQLTEEEKELLNTFDETIDIRTIGRNDMPESTIITESYFRDSLVPVVLKDGLEKKKNELKK